MLLVHGIQRAAPWQATAPGGVAFARLRRQAGATAVSTAQAGGMTKASCQSHPGTSGAGHARQVRDASGQGAGGGTFLLTRSERRSTTQRMRAAERDQLGPSCARRHAHDLVADLLIDALLNGHIQPFTGC